MLPTKIFFNHIRETQQALYVSPAKLCYLFLWWQETVLKPYGLEWNLTQNGIMFLIYIFIFYSFHRTLCPNFLFYSYEVRIIKQLVWRCHSVTPTLFLFYHIFFFTENFWRVIGNSFSVCALFSHQKFKC